MREEGLELARLMWGVVGAWVRGLARGVLWEASVVKGFQSPQLLLTLFLLGAMGQVVGGEVRETLCPRKSTHQASVGGVLGSGCGEGGGLVSRIRPLASSAAPRFSRARHLQERRGRHLLHPSLERQVGQEARRRRQGEQQACPWVQSRGCLRPTM